MSEAIETVGELIGALSEFDPTLAIAFATSAYTKLPLLSVYDDEAGCVWIDLAETATV